MNTVHTLKIWPQYLPEVESGRKTFDLRNGGDRFFQAGDILALHAWDPHRQEFVQGRLPVHVDVIAVYHQIPGLREGYVGLSIKRNTSYRG